MSERKPVRKISSLVSQLMARRGYAQVMAGQEFQRVIEAAVGPGLASSVRVGNLRGGVLHLYATDSVSLQELNFAKRKILKRIRSEMPEGNVTDLRFRIQADR